MSIELKEDEREVLEAIYAFMYLVGDSPSGVEAIRDNCSISPDQIKVILRKLTLSDLMQGTALTAKGKIAVEEGPFDWPMMNDIFRLRQTFMTSLIMILGNSGIKEDLDIADLGLDDQFTREQIVFNLDVLEHKGLIRIEKDGRIALGRSLLAIRSQ